jgi:uracil-DNA glycosylase family protein
VLFDDETTRSDEDSRSASDLIDPGASLDELRAAAAGCRGCDLWEPATQTVFGDGSPTADIMLIGEQPGDKEDLAGAPFVGPAGVVLDQALEASGIARPRIYLTNAVKHFRFTQQGKVRLHQTPRASEVSACRPWVLAEMDRVRPQIVVLLGATAGKALMGPAFRVTRDRGRLLDWSYDPMVLATIHPSAVLRTDPAERADAMAGLVHDLKVAARAVDLGPS